MKQFKSVEITQDGVNVTVANGEDQGMLTFWVDTIEQDNPRIFTQLNQDENILNTTVVLSDNKMPEVSFSEDRTYCYIKYDIHQVHVKLEDEGVVVDIWMICDSDAEQIIDSTYLEWNELYKEAEE